MSQVQFLRVHRVATQALLLFLCLPHPGTISGQGTAAAGGDFVPGNRTLFALDLASVPLDEFPKGLKLLMGNMTVADKDGVHMLKASSESEFLITFSEVLPQNFTLEFDIIPKACCNPSDLMFEGTPTMTQRPMPEELKAVIPSQPTEVRASFEGTTFELYTNGVGLFNMERKFVRGRVLRVYLGGYDDGKYAVHLSRIRVATNSPAPGGVPTPPPAEAHR